MIYPTKGGWQPIETAPKDGTEVLGYRKDAGVFLIRWTSAESFCTDEELGALGDSGYVESWWYADFVSGGRLEGSEIPSHWMPLPADTGLTAAEHNEYALLLRENLELQRLRVADAHTIANQGGRINELEAWATREVETKNYCPNCHCERCRPECHGLPEGHKLPPGSAIPGGFKCNLEGFDPDYGEREKCITQCDVCKACP